MPKKHIPERTCIGCLSKRPKAELLRFVYQPNQQIVAFDPKKKLAGRGAYLCPEKPCLQVALKRRGLDRAYRVKLPQKCYQQLTEIFQEIVKNER